jgi:hypothetical protein
VSVCLSTAGVSKPPSQQTTSEMALDGQWQPAVTYVSHYGKSFHGLRRCTYIYIYIYIEWRTVMHDYRLYNGANAGSIYIFIYVDGPPPLVNGVRVASSCSVTNVTGLLFECCRRRCNVQRIRFSIVCLTIDRTITGYLCTRMSACRPSLAMWYALFSLYLSTVELVRSDS